MALNTLNTYRMRQGAMAVVFASCFCAALAVSQGQSHPAPAAAARDGAQRENAGDMRALIRQAVSVELAADKNDHSLWMYADVDRKPGNSANQWVAETNRGTLMRVLQMNGKTLSAQEQKTRMDGFVGSSGEQARELKSEAHDEDQAERMLRMLPDAFLWTRVGASGAGTGRTVFHFRPDASFHPPDFESRVFAAMEGDMTVDDTQHRIMKLQGRLTQDVKLAGGLLASLTAGGTFQVERREVASGIWHITETHTHIDGHALLFKSIGEQEDDVRTKFKRLPDDVPLPRAEQELLSAQ